MRDSVAIVLSNGECEAAVEGGSRRKEGALALPMSLPFLEGASACGATERNQREGYETETQ